MWKYLKVVPLLESLLIFFSEVFPVFLYCIPILDCYREFHRKFHILNIELEFLIWCFENLMDIINLLNIHIKIYDKVYIKLN